MIRVNTISLVVFICCCLLSCENNKKTLSSPEHSTESIGKVEKISIEQKLKENNFQPISARIALYYRLKKENPTGYNFESKDALNMYGYSLLWDNKPEEALEIFKLNVEQFPDWFEGYDSMAEGYLANGDKDKSLEFYQKSLELNPDNFNAEDQIERIKYPNKKPETFADKFDRVYSLIEYKTDLDQLGTTLAETHLNAFKFISKEDFWSLIETKKTLITEQTTYSEFYWHCMEVIASINCSHTYTGSFFRKDDMDMALRFPLKTRWLNDQLFVIDNEHNETKVNIKDEILSINGVAVSELVNEIYKHIQSQGNIETSKRHEFNRFATAMIPYALDFPKSYEIVVKGKENSIQLNKAQSAHIHFADPSIETCKEELCFEILEDNKTAILTIPTFNFYPWNNLTFFQDYMDKRFKEIEEKRIGNLVIDVRFNGGGSSESSIHLLKYLTDKPFTYAGNVQYEGKEGKEAIEEEQTPFENAFKGKVYFIIDGNGKSTTGHFMSLVKVLNLGTIVGEELGSNQFCSAGQKIARLRNTKLNVYIANNTHETTAFSLPDETGILPDHYVTQSLDDYLNKVDAVKAFTLELIEK